MPLPPVKIEYPPDKYSSHWIKLDPNICKDCTTKATWVHHGSHTDMFKCRFDELSDVCVERVAQGTSGDNVFYLRYIHSTHPSNQHSLKIMALISGTLV